MYKKTFLFSVLFSLIFSEAFAKSVIYTIGKPIAIIADDMEWSCSTSAGSTLKPEIGLTAESYLNLINGNSKHFPISFTFFVPKKTNQGFPHSMGDIFYQYAIRNSCVVSNTKITDVSIHEIIYEGNFLNNSSAGHFQYRFRCIQGTWYAFYSKIDSVLLDDHTMNNLYDSVNGLISPLLKGKNFLSLDYEVDNVDDFLEILSLNQTDEDV